MIKIPATLEGLPAITATLAKGISVNVTLIFSLERYEQVIDAFIEGMVQADANGKDLSKMASVASFFVSRVDTAVGQEARGDWLPRGQGSRKARPLWPTLASHTSSSRRSSPRIRRWAALEAKGAKKQRPLWGLHRHQERRLLPTSSMSMSSSPRTSSTRCLRRPCSLWPINGQATLGIIPGNYDEAHDIMNDLAEVASTSRMSTDKLEADGVAALHQVPGIRCQPMSSPASTVSTADFD